MRPLGDLTYADVSESVLCWLPVNRSTLDALSHACRATRAQIARHHDFRRTTFVCDRGCHIRFSQELDAPTASCGVILRYSDQLSSLHALSLNNTSLRADEIAAVVSKCPSLRTLRLGNTCTDDKVAAAIACLAHLETLDVRYCASIADWCSLVACRTLKSLKLNYANVDDRVLAAIVSLPFLEQLSLDGCASITDFTPLGSCKSLRVLSFFRGYDDERGLDNRGLAAIASLPSLEELSLDFCDSITDFTVLRSCKSLKKLSAGSSKLDDGGLAVIASLPCLEELFLDCCESITDFTPLRARLPLRKLYAQCTKLDDRGLAAIASLSCLEGLTLYFCESITDFTPLHSCKSIRRLNAERTQLDDRGLAAIASLSCLEDLSLGDCQSHHRLHSARRVQVAEGAVSVSDAH